MRRRLAAGNWKMHGLADSLAQIAELSAAHPDPACDILICPPATLLHRAADLVRGSAVAIGCAVTRAAMPVSRYSIWA